MAKKFKLKALNVMIGNRVFRKEEGTVFDTVNYPKDEVENAFKAGFLIEVSVKDDKAAEKAAAELAEKEAAEKAAAELAEKEAAEKAAAIAKEEEEKKATKEIVAKK